MSILPEISELHLICGKCLSLLTKKIATHHKDARHPPLVDVNNFLYFFPTCNYSSYKYQLLI